MCVPNTEVGYTPAMYRREDHEVHKRLVEALGKNIPNDRYRKSQQMEGHIENNSPVLTDIKFEMSRALSDLPRSPGVG